MSEQDVVEIMGIAIGAELADQELAGGDFDEWTSNLALGKAALQALQEAGFALLPVSELTAAQRIIAGLQQAVEMAKEHPDLEAVNGRLA